MPSPLFRYPKKRTRRADLLHRVSVAALIAAGVVLLALAEYLTGV